MDRFTWIIAAGTFAAAVAVFTFAERRGVSDEALAQARRRSDLERVLGPPELCWQTPAGKACRWYHNAPVWDGGAFWLTCILREGAVVHCDREAPAGTR